MITAILPKVFVDYIAKDVKEYVESQKKRDYMTDGKTLNSNKVSK